MKKSPKFQKADIGKQPRFAQESEKSEDKGHSVRYGPASESSDVGDEDVL